jgi:hypothetical protein
MPEDHAKHLLKIWRGVPITGVDMTHLLGQTPWKPLFERAAALLSPDKRGLPLTDGSLADAESVWQGGDPELLSILRSRSALRDFTRSQGWPTPSGTCGSTLESLSAWAFRRNAFPLAMMADANGSDGETVFRLEAFREMTTFWDRLQPSINGPVRIEEWVTAPAVIEVSMAATGSLWCSQVGLERHLRARTDWRMFPATLPPRITKSLGPMIDLLRLRMPREAILRLTIALTEPAPTLLALSGAVNRLEYFPQWSGLPGHACLLLPTGSGVDSSGARQPSPGLCRLQFLRRSKKKAPFPEALPSRLAAGREGVIFTSAGHLAALLTTGRDPRGAAEQARAILMWLNQEGEASGG